MKSAVLLNSPALSKLTYHATYYPAILKKYNSSHGWVIEYSVLNAQTGKMVKFTKKMNIIRRRFTNYFAFRDYAMTLVNDINRKLSAGWSPIEYVPTASAEAIIMQTYAQMGSQEAVPMVPIQHAVANGITENVVAVTTELEATSIPKTEPVRNTIKEVVAHFLKEKSKDLRPDTMRSYKSACSILLEYLAEKEQTDKYIQDFTNKDARRYLEHITDEKNLRNVTYNNYLKNTRTFFQWALEQCYIENNPFAGIKTKTKEEKIRTLVDADTRKRILMHLRERNEMGFELVCHLIFLSLIRPKEISMLRVGDIDLQQKCIHIKSSVAKTHHSRNCAISDSAIELLQQMNIEQYPGSFYVFGKGMLPASSPCSTKAFNKRWNKLRKELDIPKEMQLYSLKDTGITEMLQANIPAITVRDHAGHHDLSITERYARHQDAKLIEKIREAAPKF